MDTVLLRVITVLTLAIAPLRAADEPRLTALRAADDERVAATVAGDRTRLMAVLSDDLHYAHSSGLVDTKTSYLDALASGRLKYVAWDYQERNFTFPAPGIALMSGRNRIKVPREIALSFLGVWREEQGRWRFLAWQSGKLPEPAGAGK